MVVPSELYFSVRVPASAPAHAPHSIGLPHVPRRERTAATTTQPALNRTRASTTMSPMGIVASPLRTSTSVCKRAALPQGLRSTKRPRSVRRRKRESIKDFSSASHVRDSRDQSRCACSLVRHNPGISRNSARIRPTRRSLPGWRSEVLGTRGIELVHDGGSLAGNEPSRARWTFGVGRCSHRLQTLWFDFSRSLSPFHCGHRKDRSDRRGRRYPVDSPFIPVNVDNQGLRAAHNEHFKM